MSESIHSNRLNMRRLRAGNLKVAAPAVSKGAVGSAETLHRLLDQAMNETDGTAVAFSVRLRLLPLSQWGRVEAPSHVELGDAVATRLEESNFEIVWVGGAIDRIRGFIFGLEGRSEVDSAANQLLLSLRRPFEIAGRLAHFDARIGTCLPEDVDHQAQDMLEAAELALESADDATPYRNYSLRLKKGRERNELLRTELEHALVAEALEVVYQPIFGIEEKRLIGVESFVRWDHPTLGLVKTPDFLKLAESTELIYGIGEYVLSRSAEVAAGWSDQQLISNCTLWINFTPAELLHADFKQHIRSLSSGHSKVTIGLELSEGPAVKEKAVCDVVRSLAHDDIRAAVDNFGGDYSTLNDLSRLPFDTLKLSRKLVETISADADGRRALELAVELAVRRGLQVIATGVETKEEMDLLRKMGVSAVQGYLFGAPLSAAEFTEQLRARKWPI